MIVLPWDARNTIFLGLFLSEYVVYSWSFLILQFFLFSFFDNIFENILKPVRFPEKAMETCFEALFSFQKNFKL